MAVIEKIPEPINNSYTYSYNSSNSYNGLSYTGSYTYTYLPVADFYTKAEVNSKINNVTTKYNTLLTRYNRLSKEVTTLYERINKLHDI